VSAQRALERVRAARLVADRGVATLRSNGTAAAAHLRQVHPVLLIGAAAVAGVVLARVLSQRRGVRRLAPLAALAGYVERNVLVALAKGARDWWAAAVAREAAETVAAPDAPASQSNRTHSNPAA
jgi:dipeptidase